MERAHPCPGTEHVTKGKTDRRRLRPWKSLQRLAAACQVTHMNIDRLETCLHKGTRHFALAI